MGGSGDSIFTDMFPQDLDAISIFHLQGMTGQLIQPTIHPGNEFTDADRIMRWYFLRLVFPDNQILKSR